MGRPPNYWDYLSLDKLLDCQRPPDFERAPPDGPPPARDLLHHDELLFIVVHQVFELWFLQLLHEVRRARDLLGRPAEPPPRRAVPEEDIPEISATLGRACEILRACVEQFRVIETMPPSHFLAFRDRLVPASGFQSFQFRLIEILAGLDERDRISFDGRAYSARFDGRRRELLAGASGEMTLREALFDWLGRTPFERVFPDFVGAFLRAFDGYIDSQKALQIVDPHLPAERRSAIEERFELEKRHCRAFLKTGDERIDRAHAAFIFLASYRNEPLLRWPNSLLERIVELEEYLRIFRFRHARMVERMIGLRMGTGGSPGVDYLDETARRYRIFGELLQARTFLLARSLLPDLPHPDLLRFRFSRDSA